MSLTGSPGALPTSARTISISVDHFFEVQNSTCLRLSIWNCFLIDFGWILGPKIDKKSIQKSIKKINIFFDWFSIDFYRFLMDFTPLRSLKIELSCTRELNFHNFDMLVTRLICSSILELTWEPSIKNRSKINKKSSMFFITFSINC